MTEINAIIIPRIGETYEAALTDPNKSIFDSRYNGFKLILVGTKNITLAASTNNQSFTEAHGLNFIPLPDAFAKQSGYSQVFRPNAFNIDISGPKLALIDGSSGVRFNYVAADATNLIFNFDNSNSSTKDVAIRYFCLEKVD